MRLEIRHLRTVLAVAEAGSISRAAAILQVTQPGLSSQLQRIEREVGGHLFRRGRDGIVVTELGKHFIDEARELVERFDRLGAVGDHLTGHDQEKVIRVGGIDNRLTPTLVTVVREVLAVPDVSSWIANEVRPVIEALGTNSIDVAVLHEFPRYPIYLGTGIEHRVLLAEPFFIGLPANHPLATEDEIVLADLAEAEWVLPPDDESGGLASFRLACGAAGFVPQVRHRVASSVAASLLVGSGEAVGCYFPTAEPRGDVVLRPIAGNPHYRRLLVAWRGDSLIAPVADQVYERMLARYLEVMRSSPVYAKWWSSREEDQS
ncbi:LysR family transcriptional regulator [Actinocrispum sp. NPDC049592]|uniref:LysR family transcriptional regulator n=1 Tax=Actinocrispum sp. NPDC049592 TaxID=3154835 RepID=UPI003449001E